MTAKVTSSTPGGMVSVLLLPHRSLSRTGLAMFLVAQSFAAGIFAGLAAWQGNVLAPVFAIVELSVVTYCLRRVWQASGLGQSITLTSERLEIASSHGVEPIRFHPYWVRVKLKSGRRRGWPSQLLIGSHGREVEIGAFLNEEERRLMAQKLSELLRPMQNGGRPLEIPIQSDNEQGDSE